MSFSSFADNLMSLFRFFSQFALVMDGLASFSVFVIDLLCKVFYMRKAASVDLVATARLLVLCSATGTKGRCTKPKTSSTLVP